MTQEIITSVATVYRWSRNSGTFVKSHTFDENVKSIEHMDNFSYVNFTDGKWFEYSNEDYEIRAE